MNTSVKNVEEEELCMECWKDLPEVKEQQERRKRREKKERMLKRKISVAYIRS